jgi:hypothetical protein
MSDSDRTEMNEDHRLWTVVSPGIIALTHTHYEIRHDYAIDGSDRFNVRWHGRHIWSESTTLTHAKNKALDHMGDMFAMGYDI